MAHRTTIPFDDGRSAEPPTLRTDPLHTVRPGTHGSLTGRWPGRTKDALGEWPREPRRSEHVNGDAPPRNPLIALRGQWPGELDDGFTEAIRELRDRDLEDETDMR